ncbi:alpha/beta fold hydrolase [Rhodococcus sp. IEGM 1401]|uniref:alpha/beta fold hydrolase n=1 Tax=unclassified Rhodococcus (in: high G+C Gram-positive bacteria) TaxID=192944 RepID=UPI0022B45A5E|nr:MULTISPECIES: alpha/beta fold hydrolase [unclassified Rhodococcus (in: high G+C Gram-positive bacteria)]MCZ4561385.1 alpha/beta fold hydrolase [Rhodococcus sp. IEGM 1401]MDI9921487.1 alpha/beta fold hydrolase [Rhodococcus sp. IEGM 1372]MDV8033981.1 alpha/beta fold hydrolase [Rhodococcus sp. IEGM 1414]
MTLEDEPTLHGMLDVGDGQRIYWEQWGPSDGVPAVYLHGGPGGTLNASQFRRHFDLSRVRAIGFEQRGCGRSTPHASDLSTSLSTNTTAHLIADIEALREHLGVDAWIVNGASWGSTLALAYALAHPTRVLGIVLVSVTTTSRAEVDWITEGVGAVFPEAWDRFATFAEQAGVGNCRGHGRIVDAYAQLLNSDDLVLRTAHPVNGHCGKMSTSRSVPEVSDAIPGGTMTGSALPSSD